MSTFGAADATRRDPSRQNWILERETGVEPATSTLARSRSTTELLPLGNGIINYAAERTRRLFELLRLDLPAAFAGEGARRHTFNVRCAIADLFPGLRSRRRACG